MHSAFQFVRTRSRKKSLTRAQSEEIELNSRKVMLRPMSNQGLFFLLLAANLYLQSDFDLCYELSGSEQHPVALSRLFHCNIIRFRSLSCIKLFEHAADEGEYKANFSFLVEAITSVIKSLELY